MLDPNMNRCGEKAGRPVWRGGRRTLEVGERLFGVERMVTVVCGEFCTFQSPNDVMSW